MPSTPSLPVVDCKGNRAVVSARLLWRGRRGLSVLLLLLRVVARDGDGVVVHAQLC